MGRTIGSVIAGYVVMACVVFATFSILYMLIGAERAYQPGTYDVTGLWAVLSLILSFLAAIAGGYVCAMIARTEKAPMALAILVVVLGLAAAIPVMQAADESPLRSGAVSNMEAMKNARQPLWVALLLPLIGAAGVVTGARIRRQSAVTPPTVSPPAV